MADESVALIDGKLKESQEKLRRIAQQINGVQSEVQQRQNVLQQLTAEAQRLQGEQRALADVYQGITGKEYKFPQAPTPQQGPKPTKAKRKPEKKR